MHIVERKNTARVSCTCWEALHWLSNAETWMPS